MRQLAPADVAREAARLGLTATEERLLAADHPFLRIGTWRAFAGDGEGADGGAARLVASIDPRQGGAGGPVGCVGFMRMGTSPAGAELDAAIDWLRAHGVTTVRCPVQLSTWYGHRAMTSGFPDGSAGVPAFPFEPIADPRVAAAIEAAGFRHANRAVSSLADSAAVVADTAGPIERARRAGVRDRPIRLAALDDDLRIVHRLAAEIFEGTWGLSDITFEEFASIYRPLRDTVNPELIRILESGDGAPIGFALAVSTRGGPAVGGPASGAAGGDAFVLKSIGVTGAARRRSPGLGAALVGLVHRAALESGATRGIHALMAEGSAGHRLSLRWGSVFRSYATFERSVR